MDSRKTLCLLLFSFISLVLFAGSISYGDVGIPEVRKPAPKVGVDEGNLREDKPHKPHKPHKLQRRHMIHPTLIYLTG